MDGRLNGSICCHLDSRLVDRVYTKHPKSFNALECFVDRTWAVLNIDRPQRANREAYTVHQSCFQMVRAAPEHSS